MNIIVGNEQITQTLSTEQFEISGKFKPYYTDETEEPIMTEGYSNASIDYIRKDNRGRDLKKFEGRVRVYHSDQPTQAYYILESGAEHLGESVDEAVLKILQERFPEHVVDARIRVVSSLKKIERKGKDWGYGTINKDAILSPHVYEFARNIPVPQEIQT